MMRSKKNWPHWLTGLVDLCWESPCPLCQRSTAEVVCQDCYQRLQGLQLPPQQNWQPPLPFFAWGIYSGALKRAIVTLKYDNQPRLASPLGDWLGQRWLTSPMAKAGLTVVPIPMHLDKQRQRGFNQAELIARSFCHRTGLSLKPQGLLRCRSTTAQFELTAIEREQNLTNAFELGPDLLRQRSAQPILLIDDIYTTGATARAAAQALRRQQMSVYGIVVVAKTMSAPPTPLAKAVKSDARSDNSQIVRSNQK